MSKPASPDLTQARALIQAFQSETTPRPANYSSEIYQTQHLHHMTPPPFTTNFLALEASAKLRLPPNSYAYAAGGASTESTMAANRSAFDAIRIVPRMLRPVLPKRDLSRTLFNHQYPAPIVMAPVGVQKLYHPEGEVAVARVFAELGLPYTLSTASSCSMTAVAAAIESGATAQKPLTTSSPSLSRSSSGLSWYQLYWPSDDEICQSYLRRAKQSNFTVLVVTLDTWELSWRPRDLDTGFHPFINGVGVSVGLEDPIIHQRLGFDPTRPDATTEQKELAYLYSLMLTARGKSPTWPDLTKLRQWWGHGPIVLKGIQSVDDALKAVEYGMDGIVVSNHGGRQVDGAVGSLQVLPGIVDAVGGKITIGFDSGVRCGADIFKVLALGADFVQLGRPILWGLAHEGDKGVRHVLRSLLADFEMNLGLAGCPALEDVDRSMLASQASPVPRL